MQGPGQSTSYTQSPSMSEGPLAPPEIDISME